MERVIIEKGQKYSTRHDRHRQLVAQHSENSAMEDEEILSLRMKILEYRLAAKVLTKRVICNDSFILGARVSLGARHCQS